MNNDKTSVKRSEFKVVENSTRKTIFYGSDIALAMTISEVSEHVYNSPCTLFIGEKF